MKVAQGDTVLHQVVAAQPQDDEGAYASEKPCEGEEDTPDAGCGEVLPHVVLVEHAEALPLLSLE